ncbi:MAG: hypothetical protein HC906_13635 [Bacteroidales bacterium]|nr:hypothetical protein [Bacteroidales bacterium]
MKTAIQIVLLIAIVALGYFLYDSIMEPIHFNKEVKIRETATVDRLKDIRTIQVAYKDIYGKYTGSFDTLINFVKNDSFPIVREDFLPGWDPDKYTKEEGIKMGLVVRSIAKKSVKDSLFKSPDYQIDRLKYIPYTNGKEFSLGAGEVMTASQVKVKVFEASAPYSVLLAGLDNQLVINYVYDREKITKFPGLKVGSLEEATNNAGNWEN